MPGIVAEPTNFHCTVCVLLRSNNFMMSKLVRSLLHEYAGLNSALPTAHEASDKRSLEFLG
jgi:hypothetical protein